MHSPHAGSDLYAMSGVHVSSLLTHPPSHLQRPVQRTPALLHLQFPVHDFRQPYCKRMKHGLLLSLRVVKKGNNPPLPVLCHPQSWKSGMSCWTEVAWLQRVSCNIALRMWWYSAAWVGGKASSDFFLLLKSRSLASLTFTRPQLLLHMTTKSSAVCIC